MKPSVVVHYHGQQLKTGAAEHRHLIMIDSDLGHARADQITRQYFIPYRENKMRKGMGKLK
ncbi:phage integrase [Moritella yayanosii]|uniref:Phage integrase N-terminal domain-containing protein n=1 Tax=Moritella yayanosii TaxID=69539 RepID=A0A330LLN2_9GAMM|nr:protein of unknown function, might related with Phage integrase [Moritella yayanosii]